MTFQIPTLTEIIDALIDRCPELGMKLTLATVDNGVATATTTDPRCMIGGTDSFVGESGARYSGWFLWVPGLTTAGDRIRTVVSFAISATVATFTVNRIYNAGDTTETAYLLTLGPDQLVGLLNDALAREHFQTTVLFTEIVDGDMQTSGVGAWTDSGSTSSKVTTAANVPFELTQSLRVLNAGRTRPALVRIPRGQTLYACAICRADVGTAVLRVADASDTEIDTLSTTQEDWMFLWKRVTPDAAVEGAYFEPGSLAGADDSYWGGVGFLRPGARNFMLPSWMAEPWQFRGLSIARFPVTGTASGEELAASRQLERLEEGVNFRLYFPEAAANPSWVELNADYTGYPLFLTGLRPYGDIDTLSVSDLTATTRCNLNLVVARARHLLGEYSPADFGRHYNKGLADADAIRRGQYQQQPKKQGSVFVLGGWGRGR